MNKINKTLWCALKYSKINLIMGMCNISREEAVFLVKKFNKLQRNLEKRISIKGSIYEIVDEQTKIFNSLCNKALVLKK